jgi:hypothetical protein
MIKRWACDADETCFATLFSFGEQAANIEKRF